MSTFSHVGLQSSDGISVCVCVCVRACVRACVRVCVEWTWSVHYVGISTYQFIPYYAIAIHKHTHTRILKPFEDSEPVGLKVEIAFFKIYCIITYS